MYANPETGYRLSQMRACCWDIYATGILFFCCCYYSKYQLGFWNADVVGGFSRSISLVAFSQEAREMRIQRGGVFVNPA